MSIFMFLMFLGEGNPTTKKFYCLMAVFCWVINKLTDNDFKIKEKCSEE